MASDLLLVWGVVKADVSLGMRSGNMARHTYPRCIACDLPHHGEAADKGQHDRE